MHDKASHISNGLDSWRDHFQQTDFDGSNVVIESTPANIYSRTALHHVPILPTRPKCLFVLREPASQIYSLYRYFQTDWDWVPPDMSFAAFLEAVRRGDDVFKGNELAQNALLNANYVKFLRNWRKRLGSSRMKVVSFEQLKRQPRETMLEIAHWVDLDPDFYRTYHYPVGNRGFSPRSQILKRLNLSIRRILPDGAIYRAMRAGYRYINHQKVRGAASGEERVLMAALSAEYERANAELEREFGVVFSGLGASNHRGAELKVASCTG